MHIFKKCHQHSSQALVTWTFHILGTWAALSPKDPKTRLAWGSWGGCASKETPLGPGVIGPLWMGPQSSDSGGTSRSTLVCRAPKKKMHPLGGKSFEMSPGLQVSSALALSTLIYNLARGLSLGLQLQEEFKWGMKKCCCLWTCPVTTTWT